MNFEEVFEHIGHFGLYQFFFMGVVGVIQGYFAIQQISMNWLGPSMDHWCKIDALQNLTFGQQKYVGIPPERNSNGEIVYSKCYRYDHNFSAYSEDELYRWNATERNLTETTKCDPGCWVYDRSVFLSSAVDKFDLVCDRSLLVPLVSTIYLSGNLVGAAMSGLLSDKFGRKLAVLVSLVMSLVFGILASFSPHFAAFVVFRFFVSVGLTAANITGSVYIMEVIGSKWRMLSGVYYQLQFAFGFMLSAAVAYAIRDFTKVQLTLIMPIVATILGTLVILESTRWLVVKGRTDKAISDLEKIALYNKKTVPETLKFSSTGELQKQEFENVGTFTDLFSSVRILKITIAVGFLWFVNALLYFGMALNVGTLAGNFYLNLFMSGLFEVPAYMLSALTMGKLGRRWSVGIFLGFGGALSIITIPLLQRKGTVVTVLSTIGKASVAASYAVAIVWSNEVFPTVVRNAGLAVAGAFQAVSGMASPFVGGPFRKIWPPLPNLVFGIFGLSAAVSSVFLIPETLNMVLPETIDDMENFGKKKPTPEEPVTLVNLPSKAFILTENDTSFPGVGHSLKEEIIGRVFYTSTISVGEMLDNTKM